jgi:GH15 family glucan-1,4-alpha-glucosidase
LNKTKKTYQPIENYGIIGDMHTAALVSITGSIDFMCFNRFDSPTIFAALLDIDRGGSFTIEPQLKEISYKQIYIPDTAILLTRFFAEDGIAELTDFMPAGDGHYNCTLIRKIKTIRGKISYRLNFAPRFNYARSGHTITIDDSGIRFTSSDTKGVSFRLVSTVELQVHDKDCYAEFTLGESESACFILEETSRRFDNAADIKKFVDTNYNHTIAFWQNWISKSTYKGRWRESINRSVITLKLLTSQEFGSTIASATFGLPEIVGGASNWDYRFTWIRDAAFSMYAFLRLGFIDEATAFMKWIELRCTNNKLQLMYAIDGDSNLEEYILPHMRGYKDSKPVRIGNQAHKQLQLDIYGELIDTIYLYNKHGGAITYVFWNQVVKHVNNVIESWHAPDHGIWEVRELKREFLHSRMMCWVALDRAIKIADNRSFPYDFALWHKTRDEIFEDIYYNFWNEDKKSFVQYMGSDEIDASVLLMTLMRILSPAEERWLKTLSAVERELKTDVLIYRNHDIPHYQTDHQAIEGTFSICSFWYIECLAKSGQVEKAREYFSKMLGYANHLGLFSEELGLRGEQLGNFPQAFTHLALISAAIELDKVI